MLSQDTGTLQRLAACAAFQDRSRLRRSMACALPIDGLCGGRYRAMNVPVAHGSYGKVVLGSDSSTGRTVVIKMQRANSDEAVREHRVFKAIRGARASGKRRRPVRLGVDGRLC